MPDNDNEMDEHLGRGLSNYLDMLEQLNEPVETDDWSAALEPDDGEYEWLVPTGAHNDEGQPVAITVRAIDPKKQSLLVAYTLSDDKDAAALSLWRACITHPEEITKRETYKNLRTKFKVGVTARLLDMLGQGADFLTGMSRRSKQNKKSTLKESSSGSATSSTSTTEPSETSGVMKNSSTDGSTPNSRNSGNDDTSSKTSDSSSPQGSTKSQSSTQSKSDSLGTVSVGTE